jgi:hypothetical protein
MSTEPASRQPLAAAEFIDATLERSRRQLAAVLDRTSALAELRRVAIDLEDERNEDRPPRARQALTFDALLNVRGDEETRARVEALTRRIAEEEP